MLRATLLAVLAGGCLHLGPAVARPADPIPPVAPWLSDAEALALLPAALRSRSTKQLVLHRSSRQLILLEQGQLRLRVPAAVGTQGWETPLGEHRVLFKTVDPVWRHPGTGALVPPEAEIPGISLDCFYQDCSIPVVGMARRWCRSAAAPRRLARHARWTVGQAVSHGCVRLYDEHIRKSLTLWMWGLGGGPALIVDRFVVMNQDMKKAWVDPGLGERVLSFCR